MKVYDEQTKRGAVIAGTVWVESGTPGVVNIQVGAPAFSKHFAVDADELESLIPSLERAIQRSRAASKALREISTAPFVEARER